MLGRARTYEGSTMPVDLEQSPFDAGPDSKIYYDLPKWREHLTYLQKFCTGHKPLSLLVGGVGAGKSTLLAQFISELSDDTQAHLINSDCSYELPQLIRRICDGFGLPLSDESTVEYLVNALRQNPDKRKQRLLIIDDAHQLPNETLEGLLTIALKQLVGLQLRVILFGENFLKKRIEVIREKANTPLDITIIDLQPFTLEETKNYIQFRLQSIGGLSSSLFSDFMLHRVHELSGGYASRINRVAQQMLIDKTKFFGSNAAANQKTKRKRRKAPYVACFLLLVIAGMTVGFLSFQEKFIPVKTPKKILVHPVVNKKPTVVQKEPAFAYIASITGLPEEKPPVVAESTPPSVEEQMADESFLRTDSTAPTPSPKKVESVTVTPPVAKPPVPPTAVKPPMPLTPVKKGYTLQLMGVHIPRNLDKYVTLHGLNAKTHLYHTDLNGQDWYVLTYGQYESLQDAQNAIKELPVELKEQQPWPRSLASLHER